MGFLNTDSHLIYDSKDNIYHFYLKNNDIIYINGDDQAKRIETSLLEKNVQQMDTLIDKEDNVLVVCKNKSRELILHQIVGTNSKRKVLGDNLQSGLDNIHIYGTLEDLNILYTLPKEKSSNTFEIMHSRYRDGEWDNNLIGHYNSQGPLKNEMKLIEDNNMYLGYMEYRTGKSILRILECRDNIWTKDIITIEKLEEIYWYDIQKTDNVLELVYAFKEEEQFTICYERYDYTSGDLIHKQYLNNPSNSMHPILIRYQDEKWISWIEMDYVLSCKVIKGGEDIEGPYKWKKTKKMDYMMYKFIHNNRTIAQNMMIKCTHVFGLFPSYNLVGLGPIKKDLVEFVGINQQRNEIDKKRDDQDNQVKAASVEDNIRTNSMDKKKHESQGCMNNDIKELKIPLEDKISEMEMRINKIENYLRGRPRYNLLRNKKK